MLDTLDKQLITAIQTGLPLTARPYEAIAKQINQSETEVIDRINRLKENGTIKRLGVVVKHRALGFKANAMVVWNIPDTQVKKLAVKLAEFDCVTLCYKRPRRLPDWPYNLFTMIHGKDRATVLQHLDGIVSILQLQDINHEALFSTQQFKQRGGFYFKNKKQSNQNVIPLNAKYKPCPATLTNPKEPQSLDYILSNYSPTLKPSFG